MWWLVSVSAAYLPVMVIITAFVMCLLVGEGSLLERVDDAFDVLREQDWWAAMLPIVGVVSISQVVFLLPVIRLRPPTGARQRSLLVSLLLGAAVAALLTVGVGLAITELVGEFVLPWGTEASPWSNDDLAEEPWIWITVPVVLIGSWFVWTFLILLFAQQAWADHAIGRVVRMLFACTVVELLLAIPIDVMVRRRTSCRCETGTFAALAIGGAALLWLMGPGLVLLATTRRRRLRKRAYCPRCGHSRGVGVGGDRCSECGEQWGSGLG
jgi:hypothetical protein